MVVGLEAIIVRKQVLLSGCNLSVKNQMGLHVNLSVSSTALEEPLSQSFRFRSLAAFPGLSAPFLRFLLYWKESTNPFSDAIHNNYLLLLYSVLLLLVAEL